MCQTQNGELRRSAVARAHLKLVAVRARDILGANGVWSGGECNAAASERRMLACCAAGAQPPKPAHFCLNARVDGLAREPRELARRCLCLASSCC